LKSRFSIEAARYVRPMAKTNPAQFVREVRQEASKVTWPTRKETGISTAMVFLAMKKQLLFAALSLLLFTGNVNAQTYCTAGPSSTADSEITGVGLVGDNYTISSYSTSCGTTGVQDFTSTDSADVSQGTSYVLNVTMGTCGGSYSGAIAAWIDFNGDGDFTDSGEQLGSYAGSPTTTQQFSFTVPSTATLGQTRLRVMQQESGSTFGIAPCNTFTWGAVEDYRINITNTAPSCGVPSNFSAVATGQTWAGLDWDAVSGANYYIVEYDTTGFTTGTGDTMWVYSDTAYVTGLAANTAYDFYVKAVCSAGASNSANVTGVYTQCAAYATPFFEDFDAGSTGSSTNPNLPNCWAYYRGGSSYAYSVYQYVYGYYSYSSSNHMRSYKTSSSTYVGDTAMSMSPVIQGLDSATKMLEFYGRKGYSSYPGELIIGVTNANGDASSLKIIDTLYMNSDVYDKYTVYLDASSGVGSGDARVAFVTIVDGVYDYMYWDDIEIKDIPPCPEPIGLS